MQVETAQDLIEALRSSGLFTPEQLAGVGREFAPFGDDTAAMVRHLVSTGRLTNYQLKKVLHDRASDLFVGPYVITDKLGSGGMGRVYRARRTADGRTVALKVVRAGMALNPTVRGRYAREVQAASALSHPNIVGMIEAGDVDGRIYIAMEFVDGIDLGRLMRDYGVLTVEEACEYARQAALGLQHAHERGFVHRDVKPGNLVVAGERHLPQATEPAVVKLLDLGLARAIDPEEMVAPHLTRDHAVVGTPDYMAPEQAKNSRDADPRSDLYSLGCTLYFLLTGRVPFPYEGPIEKILAHQTEPPPPLQALRPEVPAALAGIIVRLMAKRPEDRFQTPAEVADMLGALIPPGVLHLDPPEDGDGLGGGPAGPPEGTTVDERAARAAAGDAGLAEPGGPSPLSRWPLLAAAAVAVLLLLAVLVLAYLASPAPPPSSRAPRPPAHGGLASPAGAVTMTALPPGGPAGSP